MSTPSYWSGPRVMTSNWRDLSQPIALRSHGSVTTATWTGNVSRRGACGCGCLWCPWRECPVSGPGCSGSPSWIMQKILCWMKTQLIQHRQIISGGYKMMQEKLQCIARSNISDKLSLPWEFTPWTRTKLVARQAQRLAQIWIVSILWSPHGTLSLTLTHYGPVTPYGIKVLGQYWFRWWFIASSVPRHYLNWAWIIYVSCLVLYGWLDTGLQYLHCYHAGDTAVFLWTIVMWFLARLYVTNVTNQTRYITTTTSLV